MAQVSFYKINNSQLSSLAIKEGQIIFVQDTGKLYIDKDSSNRISVGGSSYSAGEGINISGTTISSKNSNIINGSTSGSLRMVNSAAESSSYTIGQSAFAEGDSTRASGSASHAEGGGTRAQGDNSHAEGISTKALGDYSHAEGNQTEASGSESHAEGIRTTASKSGSHAEGDSTTASGTNSHAEGSNTTASEVNSHAEGHSSTASGMSSHAEGNETNAGGNASHAEGRGTMASGEYQHVQGRYNIEDQADQYAHIVGNGATSDRRANAHTLDWSGNAWFAGNIKIGGTSYSDTNAKTLIAGPASSTELGGLKVRYDSATQTLYIRNDGSNA